VTEQAAAPATDQLGSQPSGDGGGRGRLRGWRRGGIRVYSSASHAPRARRPTDVVLLILAALGLVALTLAAPGPTALDRPVAAFIDALPGLFGWFWEIAYALLIGWALLLLILPLASRGRRLLFVEELAAGALALGFAVLLGRVAGTDPGSSVHAVMHSAPPAVYLAVRVAIATAVVVMASPHLSRPMRHIGRWILVIGALASIAMGVTLPIGLAAGFLVGVGSAAIIHLIAGSPAGLLTLDQVAAVLAELDVDAAHLRYAERQPSGVALVMGEDASGRALLVKIYGRDAWDGQLLTSAWESLSRRGQTPRLSGGRLEQVEHEAFVTLLAEREGVPVLAVVAAGMAAEGDALLVTQLSGQPLSSIDHVDGTTLRSAWHALSRLHDLHVAHGAVNADRIIVRPDGSVALADFDQGEIAASDSALIADRGQLLVTTALCVGPERAVAIAVDSVGADTVAGILPFLQPAALDRDTRKAVREADWDLKDLRAFASQRTGVDAPQLQKIRRVTWGTVGLLVLVAFLAWAIIGAISQVGLSNLIDELEQANDVWLFAALLLSPLIQVPQAFATIGASIHPVRFGPVLMLEYGIQFLALAVPSSAARVALEVRFFQRVGVDPGGAILIGALDSFCGFIIEVLLIVVISLTGLVDLNVRSFLSSLTDNGSSSSSGSSGPGLLALIAVLFVGAVIVVLIIPKYRRMIRGAIPRLRASVRENAAASRAGLRVLRSPSHLMLIFLGNLAAQVLQAIVLGLCLHAFGHRESLAALLLVNTLVMLFAGFMPVPGGMGVAEAGYTAALVALGIPNAAAMSTAMTFRLVTYYLPPIWGSFAMRWLRHHEFI
jgi:uncharacterized membrane protein YbhN (UPF0104 family)